jgi:putative hemin transport protein
MTTTPLTAAEAPTTPAEQRAAFAAQRAKGLRARDAARQLGLSEGAVLTAHAVNLMSPQEAADSLLTAVALDGEWVRILQGLETVGPVMALTRNQHVVHEKIGVYRNVSAQGPIGLAVGPEIDLRLFLMHWHAGFHVVERNAQGEQHSLQFSTATARPYTRCTPAPAPTCRRWTPWCSDTPGPPRNRCS